MIKKMIINNLMYNENKLIKNYYYFFKWDLIVWLHLNFIN